MKRVLVVALHFPPVGGAAVQRNAKFVRYLREFGWEPLVLAPQAPPDSRWTPRDDSLLDEIPPDVEVVRVPVGRSLRPGRDRLARALGRLESHERAWVEAVRPRVEELAAGTDVIFGSLVPYGTSRALVPAAGRAGRPWVADLQDPWALDDTIVYPTRLHRLAGRMSMRAALKSASRVIMNTPEAAKRAAEAFPSLGGRITTIPNGYDPSDFATSTPARGGAFRIVHTGYLHTDVARSTRSRFRSALGGLAEGVDIGTRSHVVLLEALDLLRLNNPELAGRVELHLAGLLSDDDLAALGNSANVVLHGYLRHHDATALMQSADLLFLPMYNLPPGKRAMIVPGKTYEYAASGRPILAAVPEGDARDLLETVGASLCRPDDAEAMSSAIRDAMTSRKDERPRPDALASYERSALTRRLAQVLDDAVGDPR